MPGWAWWTFTGWTATSVAVGLLVGRTLRQRDQQVPADNPAPLITDEEGSRDGSA